MENKLPESILPEKKRKNFFQKTVRFIFFLLMTFLLLITGAVTLVFVYEDEVKGIIIKELNKNLAAEVKVSPENIKLTFIKTFPHCAIEFRNITCMEAVNSKICDTLFFTRSLQLKFNLSDLWNEQYNIKKISIGKGFARLKINSKGKPNYIIFKESPAETKTSEQLNFALELIEFNNMKLDYLDSKNKLKVAVTLESVSFKGSFHEKDYDMSSNGKLFLENIFADGVQYVHNRELNYRCNMEVNGNLYQFTNCAFAIEQLKAEVNGSFRYQNTLQNLNLNFKSDALNIQSVLSLLPANYRKNISDYQSKGNFYMHGNLKYEKGFVLNTEFGMSQSEITYLPLQTTLSNLNTKGRLIIDHDSTLLELKNFSASLLNDEVKADMKLSNFKRPHLLLKTKGSINLANLNQFWPIDTLMYLKGLVVFDAKLEGDVNELKQNTLRSNSTMELDADIKNLVFRFKGQEDSTSISNCELFARDKNVEVSNLALRRGKSDLKINGKITGAFNYLIDRSSALSIKGDVQSKALFMEDIIFNGSGNAANEKKNEVSLPDNLHFYVEANLEAFYFGKFKATAVNGNVELKNNKLFAENISLNTMNGKANVDALMDLSGKNMEVSVHGVLQQINVSELFGQLNNFNQQTLIDKNIDGVLTATVDFTGTWNRLLEADLNSMTAVSEIKINQGKLVDFKPLESLAKFVDVQELKNIRFSDLSSRIEIRKGIISIPKTSIKNSALNIDVWGKHSFNNEIDYHIQLLISELLAKKRKTTEDEFGPLENDPENRRSAFILMTGTVDYPVIKYDRAGLKQKIKEDIKQEKQNMKQLLKEEFGLFKKDSIKTKEVKKADQTFKLETENKPKVKPKKEEEDEDF